MSVWWNWIYPYLYIKMICRHEQHLDVVLNFEVLLCEQIIFYICTLFLEEFVDIFFFLVLAEDAIKAALSDYRIKQQDKK